MTKAQELEKELSKKLQKFVNKKSTKENATEMVKIVVDFINNSEYMELPKHVDVKLIFTQNRGAFVVFEDTSVPPHATDDEKFLNFEDLVIDKEEKDVD
jgi:hypothetical protein